MDGTSDCIRSENIGTACMLDGMLICLTRICKTECKVIATGMLRFAMKNCRYNIIFDENIILRRTQNYLREEIKK